MKTKYWSQIVAQSNPTSDENAVWGDEHWGRSSIQGALVRLKFLPSLRPMGRWLRRATELQSDFIYYRVRDVEISFNRQLFFFNNCLSYLLYPNF